MIPEETLSAECKKLYDEVFTLYTRGKTDPPTNPFRSHLAAIDLLLQIKDNVKNYLISVETADDLPYQVLLAFVYYDLGRLCVSCDDPGRGVSYFMECIELVKARDMKSEATMPYVGAMLDLGILFTKQAEHKKSLDILIDAEKAYKEIKETKQNVLTIADVFGSITYEMEDNKGLTKLERLYTKCTIRMAEVYGILGESKQSAQYLYITLMRQLADKSYEPIDFALNAANLSSYFIKQKLFKQGRHYMAAATLIITEHEERILPLNITEESNIKHCFAYVGRRWSKYGLALLSASKERLSNGGKDNLSEDVESVQLDETPYLFPDLQLDVYEKRITCDYCLTFGDAKNVYLFVIKWLDIAKEYYKPDKDTIEYADTMKDFAKLYQLIAFFENDPMNKYKMHKRRSKYWEELGELLDPVRYMPICRECWCEAGFAHCDLLDIKLDGLKEYCSPTLQEYNKINQICRQAIKHFKKVIESYTKMDGSRMPNLNVDEQKMLMYAHFKLGRLYSETITSDQSLLLENLSYSLRYYKTFTNECAKADELAKAFHNEIDDSRKHINFLQVKIVALKNVGIPTD